MQHSLRGGAVITESDLQFLFPPSYETHKHVLFNYRLSNMVKKHGLVMSTKNVNNGYGNLLS